MNKIAHINYYGDEDAQIKYLSSPTTGITMTGGNDRDFDNDEACNVINDNDE